MIDVVGFFSKAEPRKYYLKLGSFTGSQILPDDGAHACAAGYHFASLREIFDTSNLEYNATIGTSNLDDGQGPPVGTGFIRTGWPSSGVNAFGQANCQAWTSASSSDFGSEVYVDYVWSHAATVISPWIGQTLACNLAQPVWCVEDIP